MSSRQVVGHAARVLLGAALTACSAPERGTESVSRQLELALEGVPWEVREPAIEAPSEESNFGTTVAVDGDTIVVGAPGDLDDTERSGVAYVYRVSSGEWPPLAQRLSPPDSATSPTFATDVAVSADTVAIGAPGNPELGETGLVYVFERTGDAWSAPAVLSASEQTPGDRFGRTLALSGDALLVGAHGDSEDSGAAYFFRRVDGTWSDYRRIGAPSSVSGISDFGASVDLEQDRAVVGALSASDARGRLFVYGRSGEEWLEETSLLPDDVTEGDGFGSTVVLSGDSIAAGRSHFGSGQSGAVTLFRKDGSTWDETTLDSPLRGSDAAFGFSVDLDHDLLVVGTGSSKGIFFQQDGEFVAEEGFVPDGVELSDRFAVNVAVSERTVVVGSNNGAGLPGHVYVLGLVDGHACESDGDCASGFCTEGVCCDERCDNRCNSCLSAHNGDEDGQCAPVAPDKDPRNACEKQPESDCGTTGMCDGYGACKTVDPGAPCGSRWCDGNSTEVSISLCDAELSCVEGTRQSCGGFACSAGQCKTTCESDDDCDVERNFACIDAACKLPLGAPCSDDPSDCAEGFCADDVCCDAECSGQCAACTASLKGEGLDGVCGALTASADPEGECEICNEEGSAVQRGGELVESCGRYRCSGDACLTECETSYDCAPEHACSESSKECVPRRNVVISCSYDGLPAPAGSSAWQWFLALLLTGLHVGRRNIRPVRTTRSGSSGSEGRETG